MLGISESNDLEIMIKGEFYGEAVFKVASKASLFNPQLKAKASTIAQLETQTKIRALDYCKNNGINAPKQTLDVVKGTIQGVFLPIVPWKMIMKIALKTIDDHLPVLYRLEKDASDQDKAFFHYLVKHELAIKHFVRMELANKPNESLDQIKALLD